MRRSLSGIALVAGVVLAPPLAHADPEACAQAYEKAQSMRQDGKLLESRRQLLICAQDSCPAVLRRDCGTWLNEVSAGIPSLALRVHGADGCDHPEASITLDGASVASAAEGRPIDVNPGSHVIHATLGEASTDQTVVATSADRPRLVTIELGTPGAVCSRPGAGEPAKPGPLDSAPAESRRPPALTYALGSLGIISGAVAIGFGVSAWSQKGTLDDCKGSCAQRDVDTMRRTFLIADLATLVAVASIAAGAVVYLTR
jgi:hypothetical protein